MLSNSGLRGCTHFGMLCRECQLQSLPKGATRHAGHACTPHPVLQGGTGQAAPFQAGGVQPELVVVHDRPRRHGAIVGQHIHRRTQPKGKLACGGRRGMQRLLRDTCAARSPTAASSQGLLAPLASSCTCASFHTRMSTPEPLSARTLPEGERRRGGHQQHGPRAREVGAQALQEGEHAGALAQALLVRQHRVVALAPLAAQPVDGLQGGVGKGVAGSAAGRRNAEQRQQPGGGSRAATGTRRRFPRRLLSSCCHRCDHAWPSRRPSPPAGDCAAWRRARTRACPPAAAGQDTSLPRSVQGIWSRRSLVDVELEAGRRFLRRIGPRESVGTLTTQRGISAPTHHPAAATSPTCGMEVRAAMRASLPASTAAGAERAMAAAKRCHMSRCMGIASGASMKGSNSLCRGPGGGGGSRAGLWAGPERAGDGWRLHPPSGTKHITRTHWTPQRAAPPSPCAQPSQHACELRTSQVACS